MKISRQLSRTRLMVTLEAQPNIYPPFYMVSYYPESSRSSDIYIYAIEKYPLPEDVFETATEVSITKDGGLPSSAVETGLITKMGETFGCFLRVHDIPRHPGLRYGQYQATFSNPIFAEELPIYADHRSYTFVKPKSGILNTRGVQTVTIYPESNVSTTLQPQVPIGVQWTPGCQRITWSKGKQRNINTGPRLYLKTTEDAGLYTIQRRRRAKRGFYVQILVIAASCPENQAFFPESSTCVVPPPDVKCQNGGVFSNNLPVCICPPLFIGPLCQCYIRFFGYDTLPVLAIDIDTERPLFCGDLPGGNPTCKGYLICLGDNYGCTCSSGWYGNACDRACPKGRWGVNCRVKCPKDEPDCNRFYGPKSFEPGCVIAP